MTYCEFISECMFFNDKLKNMPTASDMMKKMYCQWHYTKCARYKIATTLGKRAVPADMFPGDSRRADDMLIHYDIK
ncbi:MAG: hypothetical protein JSW69_02605 [Deltaproteobacteria bacterium]|nr:MAG: hypothetical protein JSW69_02605 [Deltaproteobacteria bacterium]